MFIGGGAAQGAVALTGGACPVPPGHPLEPPLLTTAAVYLVQL